MIFSIKNYNFSKQLRQNTIENILSSIKENGYAVVDNFIDPDIAYKIRSETPYPEATININCLGPSIHGDTQFFTNIIAHSQEVHDVITSSFVIDLCTGYLGNNFLLINNRIQTTRSKIAMPWHTDNNRLEDGKLVGRHDLPGLQFVLYLAEVGQSPFQFIKGSEKWSLSFPNQYLLDADILEQHLEIVEIYPSAGTLLILNTHVFHRAAPLKDDAYTRSILLFQVDSVSDRYPGHGEKLLIQPEFLEEITPEIQTLFGFGRKRAYPAFPETSLLTLKVRHLLILQSQVFKALPMIFFKKVLKAVLPPSIVTVFKNRSVSDRSQRMAPSQAPSNPYIDQ